MFDGQCFVCLNTHMCTTLVRQLISIDTTSCLHTLLVQYLKMVNKEEALVDVAEIGEIETKETPSCK